MDGSSTPMPAQWIERLFARLSAIYGNRMTTMWGDCPRADIVDAWGEALGTVPADYVRMALGGVMQAHPEWPPTLGQFLALCKPPPAAHRALPAPGERSAMPVDVAVLLASFGKPKTDPKRWARRILDEAEAGTYRLLYGIALAKAALSDAPEDEAITEARRKPAEIRCSTFLEIGGKNQKVELPR